MKRSRTSSSCPKNNAAVLMSLHHWKHAARRVLAFGLRFSMPRDSLSWLTPPAAFMASDGMGPIKVILCGFPWWGPVAQVVRAHA